MNVKNVCNCRRTCYREMRKQVTVNTKPTAANDFSSIIEIYGRHGNKCNLYIQEKL